MVPFRNGTWGSREHHMPSLEPLVRFQNCINARVIDRLAKIIASINAPVGAGGAPTMRVGIVSSSDISGLQLAAWCLVIHD